MEVGMKPVFPQRRGLSLAGLRTLAWASAGVLAAAVGQVSAQSPAPTSPAASETNVFFEAGGRLYSETIRLSSRRFSQALRFGSVKKGSETVDLGGRTLRRGQDYEVDYPSGTVFIKVPIQDGQMLRVSYRYDEETGATGTYGLAGAPTSGGVNGFQFNLSPQASAFVSLGLTERMEDGTVVNSNVYGLSNSFAFGPGTLKGVMMLGQREKTDSMDHMTGRSTGSDIEAGQGAAVIQNLSSKFMGGTVTAYYQDIDSRFAGFQALGASGFTSEQVNQLSREKGLKRSAFAFDGVSLGDLKFSNGLQTVGDDKGSITRRSAGAAFGGLQIRHWSQTVDTGFSRFQDTGAQDWQQLAKERGLTREGTEGQLKVGSGFQLGFNSLKVDSEGGGIARSGFTGQASFFKFDFSEQRVDPGFARFGDLRGDELNGGQLAQERGLLRRSMGVEATPSKDTKITARTSVVRDPKDDFAAMDLAASLGRWELSHSVRNVGEGFGRLGSLGGQDIGSHMAAMLNMTKAGLAPQGHDAGGFFASQGLERSNWRSSYQLGGGAKISFDQLAIKGKEDSLRATQAGIESKNVSIKVRSQSTGAQFKESSRLMVSEKAHLGDAPGFKKDDLEAKINLGGAKTLQVGQMKASDLVGDVSRTNISFQDKGFSFSSIKRDVDAGMPSLGSLADPERDLLRSLAGYSTEQSILRWNSVKGLQIEADRWRWGQIDGSMNRDLDRAFLKWNPDAKTNLEVLLTEHRFGEVGNRQVNQRNEVFTLARAIDGLGRVTFSQNKQQFDGAEDKNPDSTTTGVVLETKLAKNMGLRTEQVETRFENGERETKTSNTLSTELSKRAGVSVTETQVRRDGEKDDEVLRNYGVWYDFGRGIKLNYGYVRGLQGDNGSLNTNFEVTPGEVQGVKVDSAKYQQIRQDDKRDQHVGRVSLSSSKPFRVGWLNDVKFQYNSDTYRDQWAWQRENKNFGVSGTLGASALGFDYNSQVAPGGDRAIDRFFSFVVDRTGKSKFQASFRYGVRTLPNDQEVMIRDYTLSYKPTDKIALTHAMVTNPLANQNGVLLGTIAQPLRTNSWALNYDQSRDLKAGLFWKENQDENRLLRTREGGINLLLNASSPSPLRFTYGVQQTDQGQGRMTAHKFGFLFNQRPGPNQTWSILLENLNWQHGRPSGSNLQNWNMRMDYSWRF
jgi:hypothetical protein